jgi:hypothetical protein
MSKTMTKVFLCLNIHRRNRPTIHKPQNILIEFVKKYNNDYSMCSKALIEGNRTAFKSLKSKRPFKLKKKLRPNIKWAIKFYTFFKHFVYLMYQLLYSIKILCISTFRSTDRRSAPQLLSAHDFLITLLLQVMYVYARFFCCLH